MYFSPRFANLALYHFCFITIYTYHTLYCYDYSLFPLLQQVFSKSKDNFSYTHINKLRTQQGCNASMQPTSKFCQLSL